MTSLVADRISNLCQNLDAEGLTEQVIKVLDLFEESRQRALNKYPLFFSNIDGCFRGISPNLVDLREAELAKDYDANTKSYENLLK